MKKLPEIGYVPFNKGEESASSLGSLARKVELRLLLRVQVHVIPSWVVQKKASTACHRTSKEIMKMMIDFIVKGLGLEERLSNFQKLIRKIKQVMLKEMNAVGLYT